MWFHFYEVPGGVRVTETESEGWGPGAGGGGGDSVFNRDRVSVWEGEMSSGDGRW